MEKHMHNCEMKKGTPSVNRSYFHIVRSFWPALCAVVLLGTANTGCALFRGPTTWSVTSVPVAPAAPMVAHKSPRTAFIVLDPTKVPDQIPVTVDGENRGGTITEVRTFVTRDLAQALSQYFDKVQVIAPGQATGEAPAVLVDVKVDRMEVHVLGQREEDLSAGPVSFGKVTKNEGKFIFTWGLGLRLPESQDYAFSFAESTESTAGTDIGICLRSALERAVNNFLSRYASEHVAEKVR